MPTIESTGEVVVLLEPEVWKLELWGRNSLSGTGAGETQQLREVLLQAEPDSEKCLGS